MKKTETQKELTATEQLFGEGITDELVKKSEDMKPLLDLTKLKLNESINIQFLEKIFREVSTPNSKFDKVSKIINVKDLLINKDYGMFCSSKSLALGLAKLYKNNNQSLLDVKCKITKSVANYKDFGEKTCYIVEQL